MSYDDTTAHDTAVSLLLGLARHYANIAIATPPRSAARRASYAAADAAHNAVPDGGARSDATDGEALLEAGLAAIAEAIGAAVTADDPT
jgi:hypothetical protein